MEIYEFLDSRGNRLTTADKTYERHELLEQAVALCAIYSCDIRITCNGTFFDQVKFRKAERVLNDN